MNHNLYKEILEMLTKIDKSKKENRITLKSVSHEFYDKINGGVMDILLILKPTNKSIKAKNGDILYRWGYCCQLIPSYLIDLIFKIGLNVDINNSQNRLTKFILRNIFNNIYYCNITIIDKKLNIIYKNLLNDLLKGNTENISNLMTDFKYYNITKTPNESFEGIHKNVVYQIKYADILSLLGNDYFYRSHKNSLISPNKDMINLMILRNTDMQEISVFFRKHHIDLIPNVKLEKHLVGSMYYQLSLIVHSLLNVDGTFGGFNIKPGELDFKGRNFKLFSQDYYEVFHKDLIQKHYNFLPIPQGEGREVSIEQIDLKILENLLSNKTKSFDYVKIGNQLFNYLKSVKANTYNN